MSAMTPPGKGLSSMTDRFPKASNRWSGSWRSRPRPAATKHGRSPCCGARAASGAPISRSGGNQDKRLRSTRRQLPLGATSETSSCSGNRAIGLLTCPMMSPSPSYFMRSDRTVRSTRTTAMVRAPNRPERARAYGRSASGVQDRRRLERPVKEPALNRNIAAARARSAVRRMRPFAHGDLDDVAQRRSVAEHLVQDPDAFGDAEIKARQRAGVGRGIENAPRLGAPQHHVDRAFDAGGSLGNDAQDFIRGVRELERRIGVETPTRPARLAHLRDERIEKSFNRAIGVRIR